MPPGLASYVLGTIRRGKREKLITFLRGDSFISQSYYMQQRMTSKAAARRRDCSSQCVCDPIHKQGNLGSSWYSGNDEDKWRCFLRSPTILTCGRRSYPGFFLDLIISSNIVHGSRKAFTKLWHRHCRSRWDRYLGNIAFSYLANQVCNRTGWGKICNCYWVSVFGGIH